MLHLCCIARGKVESCESAHPYDESLPCRDPHGPAQSKSSATCSTACASVCGSFWGSPHCGFASGMVPLPVLLKLVPLLPSFFSLFHNSRKEKAVLRLKSGSPVRRRFPLAAKNKQKTAHQTKWFKSPSSPSPPRRHGGCSSPFARFFQGAHRHWEPPWRVRPKLPEKPAARQRALLRAVGGGLQDVWRHSVARGKSKSLGGNNLVTWGLVAWAFRV